MRKVYSCTHNHRAACVDISYKNELLWNRWKRNQNTSLHLTACQLQFWKITVSQDSQVLNCQMLLIIICRIGLRIKIVEWWEKYILALTTTEQHALTSATKMNYCGIDKSETKMSGFTWQHASYIVGSPVCPGIHKDTCNWLLSVEQDFR